MVYTLIYIYLLLREVKSMFGWISSWFGGGSFGGGGASGSW